MRRITSKNLLKSWKYQKINETLKNGEKKFVGGLRRPPKRGFGRLFGKKGRFGGPHRTPKNIFCAIFQCSVNFLVLSAFQQAFTFYHTHIFSRFMMFLVKLWFLVKNLGISYSKICPKIVNFKVRFQVAKIVFWADFFWYSGSPTSFT